MDYRQLLTGYVIYILAMVLAMLAVIYGSSGRK